MIRLGQLLKFVGAASGGAGAKALIASGQVTVNGEPELRRGRQFHSGDVVRVGADDLRILGHLSSVRQGGTQRRVDGVGAPEYGR